MTDGYVKKSRGEYMYEGWVYCEYMKSRGEYTCHKYFCDR